MIIDENVVEVMKKRIENMKREIKNNNTEFKKGFIEGYTSAYSFIKKLFKI